MVDGGEFGGLNGCAGGRQDGVWMLVNNARGME